MPPKKNKKTKFEPGDLVLAKMSGWSAWPSFVMPSDMIPDQVMKAKKKTTDYCVIFIPDGDFYWMSERNLENLSEEKLSNRLKNVSSKAKPKKGRTLNVDDALLAAKDLTFETFMRSSDFDNEQEDEDEEQDEGIGDQENKEGGVEEKEENADERPDDIGSDSLKEENSIDEDSYEESKTSGSKRRRRFNNVNGDKKVIKVETKNGRNSKASTPTATKYSSPKEITEEEKEHQLWLCRIKLQRSLIQRNQPVTPADSTQFPPPSADELSVARLILHRLVDFDVDVNHLKTTKIHKVLKCILKDKDLEYPDSFQLHEKCEELLKKWEHLIESIRLERQANNSNSISHSDPKAKINGPESRIESQPPEDSEISAIDTTTANASTTIAAKEDGSP